VLITRKTVTLTVAPPLCPFSIAYRMDLDYSLPGYSRYFFEARRVDRLRRSGFVEQNFQL